MHAEHDAAGAVVPRRDLVVLHAVEYPSDLVEPHRGAVAIGNDDRCIGLCGHELTGRLDRCCLVASVQRSGRQVDVAVAHRLFDIGQRDAASGQRVRIELNAYRVLLRAVYLHLRNATDGRYLLSEQVLRVLGNGRRRQRRRRQYDIHNRRVGRVHLALGRWRRHRRGQRARRGGDRRLHVLRGGVDVAVERELQRDGRQAVRGDRGHRVDAGNRRELLLQRRSDRRGHRVRVRAGELRLHLDSREIDIRQRVDRQQPISDDAEDQDTDHDQYGHHGPADKKLGNVHDARKSLPTFTLVPGASRSWPTMTTCSPGCRPLATTVSSPSARAILIARISTV